MVVTQRNTNTICAVTCQVDITRSKGAVTSYIDGSVCNRLPIQVDAAIGRSEGVVITTQIEASTICAVTSQVNVARLQGDVTPHIDGISTHTFPVQFNGTVCRIQRDVAVQMGGRATPGGCAVYPDCATG